MKGIFMKNGYLLAFVAFCILLSSALLGCGGSGGGSRSGGEGSATLNITWPERTRLIPVASNSITASFYSGGNQVATQTVARPTTGNTSTLSFTGLPTGTLQFVASAHPEEDGSGTAQASVAAQVRVTADQTTKLSVTMASTISEIEMAPAAATVSVGGNRTLTATPKDSADNAVLVADEKTTWESSNTGIATVDDDGVVTGVANGVATITFKETESGKSGTVTLTVGTGGGGGNDHLVDLANAYLDLLTDAQRAATVVEANAANAAKWSDLEAEPESNGTNARRHGVAYSSLNANQKAAWNSFVQAVLNSQGNNRLTQLRRAEDFLGGDYDGDYVYLGFVGAPSTTGNWLLHIGGHHLAHNYSFTGSRLQTTTPYFLGVEPTTFTLDGTSYSPLANQRAAMFNLLAGLTAGQQGNAFIGGNFTDLLLGAGKDARSNFPAANRGLLVSGLNATQKELVKSAIRAWTQDSAKDSDYYDLYVSELDQTYIAFSGTTNLSVNGDYVRIDGPHVWIEFLVKTGEVQGGVHYHSVWRDRVTDYNSAFSF
jgi:hypothetical protein